MRIMRAATDADIDRCHPVLVQLRPDLAPGTFVRDVRRLEGEAGYALAFAEVAGTVVAVAGYRVLDMFSRGRHLYVDDLVTDASVRSRGYGSALLDWLVEEAQGLGCARLDLDSGPERERAHAFYRRKGMCVSSLHFALDLSSE